MRDIDDAWRYLTSRASWTGHDGMLALLGQQLLLTVTALVVAAVIGLPLALWLGHIGRGGWAAINVSAVGRAVPVLALLAVLVTLSWPGTATLGPYGRGGLATIVALTLFALPPVITNGYVAVREVPESVKQAALGMGMTGSQRFWRAELPLAMPLVLSGVRLALVQLWATATIAALVAGPGLGQVITQGFATRAGHGEGIAGAIVVAVVAVVLEIVAAGLVRLSARAPRVAPTA